MSLLWISSSELVDLCSYRNVYMANRLIPCVRNGSEYYVYKGRVKGGGLES